MPPTPPTPRPRWQALLLSAVRVWLAVGLILWLGQEVVIFPGLWLHRLHDVRGAPWAEVLEVERPGGSTFPVLFADGGHDRLVLLFHGNGETADRMAPYARVLQGMGWNFAAMEYRGYAGASGWPTEAHLSADVAGTIEALRSRGQVPARTVGEVSVAASRGPIWTTPGRRGWCWSRASTAWKQPRGTDGSGWPTR